MRELKFRAWDEANKVMFGHGFNDCFEFQRTTDGYGYWIGYNNLQRVEETIWVMQYIGLEDKNRKDVYEGDVVRYNTGEIWFVEWDAKQAGFIYRNRQILDEAGRKKSSGIGYGQLPGSHEVEVIGNIYEHPELLKTKQEPKNGRSK